MFSKSLAKGKFIFLLYIIHKLVKLISQKVAFGTIKVQHIYQSSIYLIAGFLSNPFSKKLIFYVLIIE